MCLVAFLFLWKKLIIYIYYNLKLLHYLITKKPRGVMKKYFTCKRIILITLLGFFVIEKCSNPKL